MSHYDKSKLILFLLFPVSFLFFLSGYRMVINVFDEGIIVYGATRVFNGEIPYRDFWALYAPGQFYALALLFKFFGPSILVARIYSISLYSFIVLFSGLLLKRLVPLGYLIFTWFLVTILIGAVGNYYGHPMFPALLSNLLSGIFLLDFFLKRRKKTLFLSGVFAGITAVFRQDFGAYLFFASALVIIPFSYFNPLEGKDGNGKFFNGIRAFGYYLFGIGSVLLPVAFFFVIKVPLRELFSDLFLWPAVLGKFRYLNLPTISGFLHIASQKRSIIASAIAGNYFSFYFPIAIFILTTCKIVFYIRKERAISAKEWFIFFLLLQIPPFLFYAGYRCDLVHLFPSNLIAIILLPFLLDVSEGGNKGKGRDLFRLGVIYPSFFFALSFLILLSFYWVSYRVRPPVSADVFDFPRGRRLYFAPKDSGFPEAVRFIQRNVPRKEKIFVGNSRHDKVFINDVMFYFLSERDSATKYCQFDPGFITTLLVQKEIIKDISRQQVRYVVLKNEYSFPREPNQMINSSGVTELDDFILGNFKLIKQFGRYSIYCRKGASCLSD